MVYPGSPQVDPWPSPSALPTVPQRTSGKSQKPEWCMCRPCYSTRSGEGGLVLRGSLPQPAGMVDVAEEKENLGHGCLSYVAEGELEGSVRLLQARWVKGQLLLLQRVWQPASPCRRPGQYPLSGQGPGSSLPSQDSKGGCGCSEEAGCPHLSCGHPVGSLQTAWLGRAGWHPGTSPDTFLHGCLQDSRGGTVSL